MGTFERPIDLVPGTLDMLILKTLLRGPMHGYGIAQSIRLVSEGVLEVGEGSLYPALQRLLVGGWALSEWGVSDNKRRARYYRLTAAGRKQLERETQEFTRAIGAIARVLQSA